MEKNILNEAATFTQILIKKDDLLKELKLNKDAHDELFAEVKKGYYEKVKEELTQKAKKAVQYAKFLKKAIKQVDPTTDKAIVFNSNAEFYGLMSLSTTFPENHEADYIRAIRMVELSAQEHFTLSQVDFERYVLNNWSWKDSFLSSAFQYASGLSGISSINKFNRTSNA